MPCLVDAQLNIEKREPDDPCLYLLTIWTPGKQSLDFLNFHLYIHYLNFYTRRSLKQRRNAN